MSRFTKSFQRVGDEMPMRPGARKVQRTVVSTTYTPGPIEASDLKSVVTDAFTYRGRLVVLQYAQQTLYVSVKNTEANTDMEALELAQERAAQAHRKSEIPLGDLICYEVHKDTDAVRAKFKVDGSQFEERKVTTLGRLWRNAA